MLTVGVGGDISITLFVQPKAKRTAIVGIHDNMLKLTVAAPPVDDKANREVKKYMAGFFGIKKSQVDIIAGKHSRRKVCTIGPVSEHEVREKIDGILQQLAEKD